MSKSIEDYRNIVKILKLQLLKVREDNASISHALGIASETETSSFTPKITHYIQSDQPFAKNILAFLNFAHRCEIIGVAPEMIFRIADKKRDKKVSLESFRQILKRLKLRLTDMEIKHLTNLITKSSSLYYEEYLQCLSAFQINSQKFPVKNSRTYVQLSLIKFAKEARQKYKDADRLYREIGKDNDYIQFDVFTNFVTKNLTSLKQTEVVAIFVGLDIQTDCKIQKNIFKRQIGKIFKLLDNGINVDEKYQQEVYYRKDQVQNKGEAIEKIEKSEKKIRQSKRENDVKDSKRNEPSKNTKKEQIHQSEDEMKEEIDTGVQAGNKTTKKKVEKPKPSESVKEIKLDNKQTTNILDAFRKENILMSDFLFNLLEKANPKKNQTKNSTAEKSRLVKSFTLQDFSEAIKEAKESIKKKSVMDLFKLLDSQKNGTIDSAELLKLWLRFKDLNDDKKVLYKLLYRHLREIQYPDPMIRFTTLGGNPDDSINQKMFGDAFKELDLTQDQIKYIVEIYLINNSGQKLKLDQLSKLLQNQGKSPINSKSFKKMEKDTYDQLKNSISKVKSKRKDNGGSNKFKRFSRIETQEASVEWESIFTDAIACFEYCLQKAYQLQTFWRDPQFGPTKADPHGMRSIIGNQSNPPPAIPEQQFIVWMTFEEMLAKKENDKKPVFMKENLVANDVKQGTLGDCWFVSALSIIANNDQFIKGKTPAQCNKNPEDLVFGINPFMFQVFVKYGLYVFKYFKDFKPIFVVVDDLFPVNSSFNDLIFGSSPDIELQWVAFLQKSYAKLHHTYSSMISGDIAQGLNDLTNALPVRQNVRKDLDYWEKIIKNNEDRQLMGCSIKNQGKDDPSKHEGQHKNEDGVPTGLLTGHAYSIVDVLDLKTKSKEQFNLLRIRNPHGEREWRLDWSDNPIDKDYDKLSKYLADIQRYYKEKRSEAERNGEFYEMTEYERKEDGEFMISFKDFSESFTNMFTGCFLQDRYKSFYIKEQWGEEVPSGICKFSASEDERRDFVIKNHQYVIDVKNDDTDVLMYLIQSDGRLFRGEKYPYTELCNSVVILIFNLDKNQPQLKAFDVKKLFVPKEQIEINPRRDYSFWKKFNKGKYAVLPCKKQNNITESNFQFRIYFDNDLEIKKMSGNKNQFLPLKQIPEAIGVDKSICGPFVATLEKIK